MFVRSFLSSFLLILLTFISFFTACSPGSVADLERERLFTLSYGRFEDQIDLFNLENPTSGPNTQIFMRDGMFYISNSGSKKLIQLTSFGDLLSVLYNADTNPAPSFAEPLSPVVSQVVGATTRRAVAYPFNSPVFLAVDSLKRLSVIDRLPEERYEFDQVEQVMLREVVLRFSPEGQFLDFLGQEGPGGTPFPPVVSIHTSRRNELIVVTKNQVGIKLFWFNADGNLLFRIPVVFRNLPTPYESGEKVFISLEKILPDYDSRRMYLKLDYYTDIIDAATKANAGIKFERSCVYPFNIETGKYEERIDLPVYESVETDELGTISFTKPYELLGITSSGWFFLQTPIPEGYRLEMYDHKSKRIHSRVLHIQNDELVYNALMLSNDGIVSGLLATPYEASVVWWRTDALIGEIRR